VIEFAISEIKCLHHVPEAQPFVVSHVEKRRENNGNKTEMIQRINSGVPAQSGGHGNVQRVRRLLLGERE
jgi:hypothetical protein